MTRRDCSSWAGVKKREGKSIARKRRTLGGILVAITYQITGYMYSSRETRWATGNIKHDQTQIYFDAFRIHMKRAVIGNRTAAAILRPDDEAHAS